MKKILLMPLWQWHSVCVMFAVLMLISCGSSKKLPQASKSEIKNLYGTKLTLTEVEKYALDMPGKRASGKGVSASESAARQLAELDARANFSNSIDAAILAAAKNMSLDINQYAGGDNDGMNNADGGRQSNTLTKSISSNIIANTNIVKIEKFYGKNRQYTIFVCLEYNGSLADMAQKAAQQVKQRVSDADRAKLDANFKEFQHEIEEELSKKTLD